MPSPFPKFPRGPEEFMRWPRPATGAPGPDAPAIDPASASGPAAPTIDPASANRGDVPTIDPSSASNAPIDARADAGIAPPASPLHGQFQRMRQAFHSGVGTIDYSDKCIVPAIQQSLQGTNGSPDAMAAALMKMVGPLLAEAGFQMPMDIVNENLLGGLQNTPWSRGAGVGPTAQDGFSSLGPPGRTY